MSGTLGIKLDELTDAEVDDRNPGDSKRQLLALLEERAQWRQARADLYAFALYLAPPEYQFSWHHQLLYKYLNDFAEGRRKRLIIEMPPGTRQKRGGLA